GGPNDGAWHSRSSALKSTKAALSSVTAAAHLSPARFRFSVSDVIDDSLWSHRFDPGAFHQLAKLFQISSAGIFPAGYAGQCWSVGVDKVVECFFGGKLGDRFRSAQNHAGRGVQKFERFLGLRYRRQLIRVVAVDDNLQHAFADI